MREALLARKWGSGDESGNPQYDDTVMRLIEIGLVHRPYEYSDMFPHDDPELTPAGEIALSLLRELRRCQKK